MHKIYAIGETVLDIIFENNEPKTAKPGGSTLNSSVSLGRLGLPIHFISEWGKDKVGNIIDQFLNDNHVNTDYVYRFDDARTILAMAFLDEQKNASYEFYKNLPDKRLQIEFPVLKKNDIVLFSSFFAVNMEVRPILVNFLKNAIQAKAIIIYDPNFRKSHSDELGQLKPLIEENISMADIVRGSDEDFKNIFNANSSAEAYYFIKQNGCKNLIYTANSKGVNLHSENHGKHYKTPVIEPISTIGAGDNFNAGIIYSLYNLNISKESINKLTIGQCDKIIKSGINFSQNVCLSWENYISKEFAKTI